MRVAAASRDTHLDGFVWIDRFEIHREVLAVTRRLGESARRIFDDDRVRVAREELAATATPLGHQAVAAEQRAIADNQDGSIYRHRVEIIDER